MSGHIVNIPREVGSHSASKAGCVRLARQLAVEWREFATVNMVSPGYADTGLADFLPKETGEYWNSLIPLAQQGVVRELMGVYVYLASDASSYATGAGIVVDGANTAR